ncbi:MAG TPA: GNAT family N-acetyltransferase [Candidatus Baltobacteraceae bacterium]
MAVRVERLSDSRRRATLAFLEAKPYENVFLIHAMLYAGAAIRSSVHVAIDDADAIAGVGFFGRQVVLAARDPSIVDAFVELGIGHKRERMIVGPVAEIARYWDQVAPRHAPARTIRERQPLLAVTPATLRGESDAVRVRRAAPDDCDYLTRTSAQMIEGELGYDPRTRSPGDFEAGIAQMVERGLWWVGEDRDGLCFSLNVGPFSDQTIQLQGIYAPPERRGAGRATAALAGICRQLFDEAPTLSLFVNDFNAPALALYERTGFQEVGAFRSILF